MKPPELLEPANREEARLLERLDARRLPRHIAIIMDGNGRWAQRRHLPRVAGHRAGVQSARTVIETCARLHIPALTLYAFSLENWRRPKAEIDFLSVGGISGGGQLWASLDAGHNGCSPAIMVLSNPATRAGRLYGTRVSAV